MSHISVLLNEVLDYLVPDGRQIERVIDGTLGAGGHTFALLQHGVKHVLGLDLDEQAIALTQQRMGDYARRITIVNDSYANMTRHAQQLGWDAVDAILLDLGVSSMQLDTPERGFAFRFDAPLDMRFTDDGRLTAADIVNAWTIQDLADIFYRYGEEQNGKLYAKAIVANRPLHTTQQLANLIDQVTPKTWNKRRENVKTIHPATKVFQALRIVVNDELQTIETALPKAIELLKPGGRLAVISFHSLEDAIVKRIFRDASTAIESPPGMASILPKEALVQLLTKKPIEPSPEEIQVNPRARSSKLRVVEKL